ncbi:MAG: (Fe-S)-binding protein [Bacillota bacterium]
MAQAENILEQYYNKCVRCGQCRQACPVLQVSGKEPASPRGKVYLAGLMQRGEISPGRAGRILSLCLMCGACTFECPSGLPVDGIIRAARGLSSLSSPFSPGRAIYRNLFSRTRLVEKLPGFLPVARLALYKRTGIKPERTARKLIPQLVDPENRKPAMRVGYFLGCITNYLLPGVALATVDLLSHLGCQVITPEARCCGLPLAAAGDTAAAEKNMETNRRIFSGLSLDAVVTDCPSCSFHLTGRGLTGNSEPVYELTEFLLNVLDPRIPGRGREKSLRVAWHDPCHLRYGRNLAGITRRAVEMMPEVQSVEIPGGSSCCGGGGAFSLTHGDLSKSILEKYTARIKSSGARVVATSCPSCIIQLSSGLKAEGGINVLHPAQMLVSRYRKAQFTPSPKL